VPPFWRVNGNFYVWRLGVARHLPDDWLSGERNFGFEIPDEIAFSIDTLQDLMLVDHLLRTGWFGTGFSPFAFQE